MINNPIGYIYKTTSRLTGECYIGQHGKNFFDKNYHGTGIIIKDIIKKYGKENLECFPLAWAWTQEELNFLEIEYIAHYRPKYNIAIGGKGSAYHHSIKRERKKPVPRTHEHCQNISKSLKGKKKSPEHAEKCRKICLKNAERNKNNPQKESHRKKSQEHCLEMNRLKKGVPQPLYIAEKTRKTQKKAVAIIRGSLWWTNGIDNKRSFRCPKGYVHGMKRKEAL
jgi:hypothetical protein